MRKSGVLLHISSLPGKSGIGTLGKEARDFVDFLQAAGQTYWQVLPVCPTGYGDSPYQSFCCEAGNPYFIDLDELSRQGLLDKKDYESVLWGESPYEVDYGILYRKRQPILAKAANNFLKNPSAEYRAFQEKNAFWIDDYAVFMTLKNQNNGKPC